MNGAEFIISALRAQGVDTCFMVPGNLVNPFSIPMTGTPGFRTIVAGHEGGAALMAAGYAAATTGLGVAIGIDGPGVLNMAAAIAAVRAERLPLLIIGGEGPTHLSGPRRRAPRGPSTRYQCLWRRDDVRLPHAQRREERHRAPGRREARWGWSVGGDEHRYAPRGP